MLRKTNFDEAPMKPMRVYEKVNKVFGRDTCYVSTIGLSQITAAFKQAKKLMNKHKVPVVVELVLKRVTNIAMGVEINAINELELLAESSGNASTALA